jgi:uncharacterized protein
MDKINILNRKNHNLSAFLHTPEKETNKIIIIAHSFKAHKDCQPILREFSETISKEDYAVIRFDFWGTGESDGAFEDSSFTTQIEDLQDVIEYVKSKGYNDICLIGMSQGSTDSIMAYDNSIKCMVFWSPVFKADALYEAYKEDVLRDGYIIRKKVLSDEDIKVGKVMWQELKDIQPVKRLHEIECPVLAIIGDNDKHISEENAKKFMAMIPSENRLEVMAGGDHDFTVEDAKIKAIQLSVDFVKKYL